MNFHLRGLPFNNVDSVTVKKYSQTEPAELGPLTNRGLIKLCDKFLVSTDHTIVLGIPFKYTYLLQPLKHGNVLHGSSHRLLKNLQSDAESAYPLVPEPFYGLLCEFLDIKLKNGSRVMFTWIAHLI